MDNEKNEVIKNDTCFAAHKRHKSACPKSKCRYWADFPEAQNCSMNAASTNGGMTLEQIGQVFNLTRMRVCQIEKGIYNKLRPRLKVLSD